MGLSRSTCTVALLAGVVALHGVASKVGIGAGTVSLFAATIWNAHLPVACDVSENARSVILRRR
jgi:hypothetical protein